MNRQELGFDVIKEGFKSTLAGPFPQGIIGVCDTDAQDVGVGIGMLFNLIQLRPYDRQYLLKDVFSFIVITILPTILIICCSIGRISLSYRLSLASTFASFRRQCSSLSL
jgi:hypothetical protein